MSTVSLIVLALSVRIATEASLIPNRIFGQEPRSPIEQWKIPKAGQFRELLDFLVHPTKQQRPYEDVSNVRLGHFSWKTCGQASDTISVNTLTLQPDPIKLGEPVMVTATGVIGNQIDAPVDVSVTIQKKVFVWITVPCVDNLGSCNYTDVCSLLPPKPCPEPFEKQRIPCTCPFPAGTYSLDNLPVTLTPSKKIPSWLSEGDFKAHVVLSSGDQELGCFDVELNIVAADGKPEDDYTATQDDEDEHTRLTFD